MTMMQQQMPRPDRRGSNAAERIRDEDYTSLIEKMGRIVLEKRMTGLLFLLANFSIVRWDMNSPRHQHFFS
jgi:hypothetical protein